MRFAVIRVVLLGLMSLGWAYAQGTGFPLATLEDDTLLGRAMPRMAEQALEGYQESDRVKKLDTVFRLQMVAGRYADAIDTIRQLRELQSGDELARAFATNTQFEIFARAKLRQAAERTSFEEAFARAFRDVIGKLDAVAAASAIWTFGRPLAPLEEEFNRAVMSRRDGRAAIGLPDMLDLVPKYLDVQVYQAFRPVAADAIAEDDRKRYFIDDNVSIPAPDGASLRAIVMRPRALNAPAPTLMTLTIYAGHINYSEARRTAARGYPAVYAFNRGKAGSPGLISPYEHDGEDAVAVIDWITKQSWSDGRVGIFGGSYSGGTAWAAAKHHPPALKALMTSVPVIPGMDVPMEGNVFQGFVYSWPFYAARGPGLDDAHYGDQERWNRMFRTWYRSGQAYSALDKIDGTPNPIFHRWLEHSAYDAYWQAMAPTAEDYARISIPILETAGFLEGQSLTASHHFREHLAHNAGAAHYVVLGPYNHFGAQRRPADFVGGYRIDAAARINIEELRYDWFDHVLKGAKKPALLADRVNYEVMGANAWKHAPSIEAMSNGSLRLFLSAASPGGSPTLGRAASAAADAIALRVDLSDRSDVDRKMPASTLDRALDSANGVVFTSEPMDREMEVSGRFGGSLEFTTNKRDFDLNVALYERLPSGEYFSLSYYLVRASYAADLSRRRLLAPDRRERITFQSQHVTSKRVQAGSRLVLVLGVVKQVDTPINYGSGKDPNEETIADSGVPLEIHWGTNSYIDVPTWR